MPCSAHEPEKRIHPTPLVNDGISELSDAFKWYFVYCKGFESGF